MTCMVFACGMFICFRLMQVQLEIAILYTPPITARVVRCNIAIFIFKPKFNTCVLTEVYFSTSKLLQSVM